LFSIFYQPKHIKVEQQFFLNMAVSVAIVEVFKEFEVDIKIKWPNDILIKNKKISGILVENTIQGNLIISSIIGIGINVNQTIFEDLPHASSLKNELDYEISIENLFNSTLESITQWINVFENQNFFKIKELYLKNLYGFEELKQFNKDGQFITAKIADIDMYGRIVLKENGRTKAFQFGEIHQMYQ
jgi:BirA family biotin operon repressor/biotin-[acetyl-CoA-carboxylase] ligase